MRGKISFVVRHFETLMPGRNRTCLAVFETYLVHYNHSISFDAKLIRLENCPIIGEHASVYFVVQ